VATDRELIEPWHVWVCVCVCIGSVMVVIA